MNTYMTKSPIYYAVSVQGCYDKTRWNLSNRDEIDEFAKKFSMYWYWNTREGVLSFKDRSEGMKLNRPEHVRIGDVVVAYDDWGTWRVQVWTSREFEKKFIQVDGRM